jgi:alcohol dehydrogenase class IV
MQSIQVNEELLADSPFFSSPDRRAELGRMFQFDRRRVILGENALSTLGQECRRLEARSVFLVRDQGVAHLEPMVRAALDQGGIALAGTYEGVVANPTVESVQQCAQAVGKTRCAAVIALGGGSTLDTAKAGLCVAATGKSVDQFFGFDLIPHPPPWPLIAIPTTAGTGSEASRVSVVADATGKKAVYSDHLQPRVALVDPLLHRDLPPVLTAVTGLDALGHALECTASKKSNALGDAVARQALLAGCPHLARAIERGQSDPQARYQMARSALLAGLLLSPINTGAAHALGYGIEKVSHEKGSPVPHGTAVALVLPGVMRHNAPAAADKYYYAAGVAGLDLKGRSREQGVELAAGWIDGLRRKYAPHASLAQAGLGEEDIPRMVEIAMTVRRLLDPNPVEVRPEDAAGVYRAVLR